MLTAGGVPCGPIYTMDQVFADPQVQHLGASAPVNHPELGELHLLNQPVKLSRTPANLKTASPIRGAHTREVLIELGLGEQAIENYFAQGVV